MEVPMFFSFGLRKYFRVVLACFFLAISVTAFARPRAEVHPSDEKVIVASTSWVAAIAEAAGARNVRILAPVELRHPPEYELRPSDIALISMADVVLYAGWERFAQKLVETTGSGATLVQVRVENEPDILKEEAQRIASILGTEDYFLAWRSEFELFTQDLRSRIHQAYPDRRAVVQRMQLPLFRWLGFDIVGEYGPAEPSLALILELARLAPVVVVDNFHNPSGMPIAATAGVPYAVLINFPGKDGTATLIDVFRYNAEALINAKGQ